MYNILYYGEKKYVVNIFHLVIGTGNRNINAHLHSKIKMNEYILTQ